MRHWYIYKSTDNRSCFTYEKCGIEFEMKWNETALTCLPLRRGQMVDEYVTRTEYDQHTRKRNKFWIHWPVPLPHTLDIRDCLCLQTPICVNERIRNSGEHRMRCWIENITTATAIAIEFVDEGLDYIVMRTTNPAIFSFSSPFRLVPIRNKNK